MPPPSQPRLLLAVAAPNEARAILSGLGLPETLLQSAAPPWTPISLSPALDLLVTGVGKANAAAGVARALCTVNPHPYHAVLNLGIAGSLPSFQPHAGDVPVFLPLGTIVLATSCIHSDEGVDTPGGFQSIVSLGFSPGPYGMSVPTTGRLCGLLRPLCDRAGPIATVSTCSGTDARARAIVARHDSAGVAPIAEGMEGAAVAHVAHTLGIDLAEMRVISNTTGDRDKQVWDFKAAFAVLGALARKIAALPPPA